MTVRRRHRGSHLPTPLRELFEGHAPFVYRSLGYLGVPEHGLDPALRRVFALVFQQLAEYPKQKSVRAWLYSLCARVSHEQGHHGSPVQSQALALYELEAMPLAEVAQALHCTPRIAYAQLQAARAVELAVLSTPTDWEYRDGPRLARTMDEAN